MKIVTVKFREKCSSDYSSKPYVYKSHIDVNEGDLVVVETVYGPSVAMVVNDDVVNKGACECCCDDIDIQRLKHVIQLVDTSKIEEIVTKEERYKQLTIELDKLYYKKQEEKQREEWLKTLIEVLGEDVKPMIDELTSLSKELGV